MLDSGKTFLAGNGKSGFLRGDEGTIDGYSVAAIEGTNKKSIL